MIFGVVPILLLVSMVLVGRHLLDFPFLAKQILLSLVQSSVQPRKRWPWTPLERIKWVTPWLKVTQANSARQESDRNLGGEYVWEVWGVSGHKARIPPLCPYNSCPLMLVPCTLWPVILLPGLRPNISQPIEVSMASPYEWCWCEVMMSNGIDNGNPYLCWHLWCQWDYVSFWCVIPLLMNKSLTRAYDRFQGLLCVFGCLCPKKGGHGGRWRPIWIPFWWLLHSPGRTQKILEYGVRGYYMLWTTSWLSECRSKMIQSQSLPLNVVYPWYGPAKWIIWINQHKSNHKLCLLIVFSTLGYIRAKGSGLEHGRKSFHH